MKLSPQEYERLQPHKPKHYRIRTLDKKVYAVARWSVTDSTLVIEEFDRRAGADKDSTGNPLSVPYTLDLVDVSSIEQLAQPEKWEIVLVATVVVLFVLFWAISRMPPISST